MHTTHARAATAANPTPAVAAVALVRDLGPTRALTAAQARKDAHPEYSPAACYYDEVARLIERGMVAARAVAS